MTHQPSLTPAHLPVPEVASELEKHNHFSNDGSKYYTYSLVPLSLSDVTAINATIEEAYYTWLGESPPQHSDPILTVPDVDWDFTGRDLQAVFDFHMKRDKEWRESGGKNNGRVGAYPFGFVVVPSPNWKEDGIVVVTCEKTDTYFKDFRKKVGMDERDGVWWVDAAKFRFEEVGWIVTSMWRDGDEGFQELKLNHQIN